MYAPFQKLLKENEPIRLLHEGGRNLEDYYQS